MGLIWLPEKVNGWGVAALIVNTALYAHAVAQVMMRASSRSAARLRMLVLVNVVVIVDMMLLFYFFSLFI
jgi:hypothetical protein